MDLNQLLHRHQVSLMRADDATSPEERRAHEQFALDLAATIHSARNDRGVTDAPSSPHVPGHQSGYARALDAGDQRISRFVSGRVVRTPESEMPYKVVLTDVAGSTEHDFPTMRECELFIRDNTPAPPVRSTLYDRDPPKAQNTSNFLTQVLAAFIANPRTRLPAILIRANGSEEPVVITEVSEGGFRVSVGMTPSVDEHVHIRSEGHGDVAAQIRWAHGTEAGGSF